MTIKDKIELERLAKKGIMIILETEENYQIIRNFENTVLGKEETNMKEINKLMLDKMEEIDKINKELDEEEKERMKHWKRLDDFVGKKVTVTLKDKKEIKGILRSPSMFHDFCIEMDDEYHFYKKRFNRKNHCSKMVIK